MQKCYNASAFFFEVLKKSSGSVFKFLLKSYAFKYIFFACNVFPEANKISILHYLNSIIRI
jgi:hypothetical protein